METTIGELIERVKGPYNKGVASVSSRLTNRYVYSKLSSSRSRLLTQQIKKKQIISDWNYTILPCVELISVPDHECPCIPSFGCKVYRSKYKLPKVLTDLNIHLIKFVMNITNGIVISETTREDYIYNAGNKYTNNHLKYILENGYLFVYGKNIPKLVRVKLLSENAIEALNFPSFCEQDCTDCQDCDSMLDKAFPIDGDLIDTLVEMAQEEVLIKFSQGQEDLTNNSVDTVKEQGK